MPRAELLHCTAASTASPLLHRRDAFTTNMLEMPQGQGSGFLWDDMGHVVTNYHVSMHISIHVMCVCRAHAAVGESTPPRVSLPACPYIEHA